MNFKLYTGFGFVALASAIVALGRLAAGQDPQVVIPTNVTIGGVCVVVMLLLMYREKRKTRISHGT
jgi:hypothetical protein